MDKNSIPTLVVVLSNTKRAPDRPCRRLRELHVAVHVADPMAAASLGEIHALVAVLRRRLARGRGACCGAV
jgi:hypothetical protein